MEMNIINVLDVELKVRRKFMMTREQYKEDIEHWNRWKIHVGDVSGYKVNGITISIKCDSCSKEIKTFYETEWEDIYCYHCYLSLVCNYD